ncbi:MAG TPA: hypothetical protein VIL46_15880 [Gemmataceae bacterium]
MNCTQTQRHLMTLEDVREASAAARAHLEGCAECREWLRALRLLDRALTGLPVPATLWGRREELLRRFRGVEPPPALEQHRRRNPFWARWAATAAAAVLVVGLAAWLLRPGGETPVPPAAAAEPDPLLAELMERHVRLAVADTPRQRLEQLAGLAADLRQQGESLALVAPGEEMKLLADLYRDVVHQGMIAQAGQLAVRERQALLGRYARELGETSEAMARLAERGGPPHSVEPLGEIADAARQGSRRLRQLIKGEG